MAGLGGKEIKLLCVGGVLVVDGHVGTGESKAVLDIKVEAAGAVFQHKLIAHLFQFPLAIPAAGVVGKGHLRTGGAAASQGKIGVVARGDAVIVGAGDERESEDLVGFTGPGIQHATTAIACSELLVQNVAFVGEGGLDGEALAAGDG